MLPKLSKVTFSVLFVLFKAEISLKINITSDGENKQHLSWQDKVWNLEVTFLRIFILFSPLENFGMYLRFLCSAH